MPFVKVVKNKAYFKRFQVKYRRRREGKTDYAARRQLVLQDKNKYNSPKYRFVVRRVNDLQSGRKAIGVFALRIPLNSPVTVCPLDSPITLQVGSLGPRRFDRKLRMCFSAYCTGLLCARRLLHTLGLDKTFQGLSEVTGEVFHVDQVEMDEGPRPFKALMDVGLSRTTTGCRIFGAMKGASDGGLNIPHSHKRFPGYNKEEDSYDASCHRDRILGKHIGEYMRHLKEDSPEDFNRHFSRFIKHNIEPDQIEQMYIKCHAAIRANPEAKKKEPKEYKAHREGNYMVCGNVKYLRPLKLSAKQKADRVLRKLEMVQTKMIDG